MSKQNQIIEALRKPEAYIEKTENIEVEQTHISYIFFTKDFVYKVKKPVNFGFLDFTTLEKRKKFCEKELKLNRRLCGDMYIKVVPITKSAKQIKINGQGKIVEYAVKMKRIPQENMMSILLDEDKVDYKLIDKIAKIIVEFHLRVKTNKRIKNFGSLKTIEKNWVENFIQTKEFVNKTITPEEFSFINNKVNEFMKNNKSLFTKRVLENRIKDCHGDIHSGNIFISDKIYIFDAIEFNERFRYSDVASEVAFLAMDLDKKGKNGFSNFLVERYIKYSNDQELQELLAFYKCYRAYVRGKVIGFKLNDLNVNNKEKIEAKKEASNYFKLASDYAKQL
ncbi:gluconokinase [Candidatus Bathyarchaeota archaeon]|nr:gluconokinase [Candidatus Bathyarchaeota archaeon]